MERVTVVDLEKKFRIFLTFSIPPPSPEEPLNEKDAS
jgi:hypothetical protein